MTVPQILGELNGQPALFDPGQRALKVPCVCVKCNTVWMKAIEDATIPVLGPLIDGTPSRLDILQQWTIAVWAVKTAMVFEYVSSVKPLYYRDEEKRLFKDSTTRTPPSFTGIWLWHNVGPLSLVTFGADADSSDPTVGEVTAFNVTMAFGKVGIQVISVRPNEGETRNTVIHPKRGPWAETTLRIWPTNKLLRWPPPRGLGSTSLAELYDFHLRFHSQTSEIGGQTDDDVIKVSAS